jgi:hypothetical protein
MARANKKRTTKYIPSNDRKYGLKNVKATQTQVNIGLQCRFCHVFGREERAGQKRKPSSTAQSWSPPYRYDNIESHMSKQHREKWALYKALETDEEREAFFSEHGEVYRNTLRSHFVSESAGERAIVFDIDQDIVEVIVGDMFFKPGDEDGEQGGDEEMKLDEDEGLASVLAKRRAADERAKERALDIFKIHEAESEEETTAYTVTIPKTKVKLFNLAVRYVSCGASFRQVSNLVGMTYEVMQDPLLRSCPRELVSKYVRVACAVNLQRIKDLLNSTWAFSLALDVASHQSRSYLDVRFRVFVQKTFWRVFNLHIAALPIHDRHTGEVMFSMISLLLDVLCPEWKTKLLGVASDGARNMTGRNAGVVTRLGNALPEGCVLIRIWCGAHQLDLVMQFVMDTVVKENFFSDMTAFISHLGRQQLLQASMESTCPRVVNRWLSTDKVTKWLKNKRPELLKYIEDKKPASAPPDLWWVYLVAMECFTSHSAKTFRNIQGLTTLVSQQAAELDCLVTNYIEEIGAIGPLTDAALSELDESEHAVSGRFAVALCSVREFVLGLASWTNAIINAQTDENKVNEMLKDIGMAFVIACDRISGIVVERNDDNSALNGPSSLPPVLPHELVQMTAAEFLRKARHQAIRLETFYDSLQIDVIADQHKELIRAYRNEPVLRAALDECTGTMSFEAAWGLLGSRFADLCEFCGCIATLFPGTATVEADFSVLRWENDGFRKSLSDFGLEGVMQTKQYTKLEALGDTD